MKPFGTFLVIVALIAGMVGCGEATPPTRYSLTMAVAPSGGGTVTDLTSASPYAAGATVSIKAVANAGYHFVKWTTPAGGFADTNAAQTTFTIPDQDVTVTAHFEAVSIVPCNLSISSTAGGSVITPGAGTFTYNAGMVVNLVAAATSGYRFISWTSSIGTIANVTAASTTIMMNGNYSIMANFEEVSAPPSPHVQYNLNISSATGGSVTNPGEGTFTYDAGTVVSLLAIPASGYQFIIWTGNVASIANINSPATIITMNGNYSIAANFSPIPPAQFSLTISSAAGGSVTMPGERTFTYSQGTVVNLVATPHTGYRFAQWTGNVGTIANINTASTTITMNGDYSITANFMAQYQLTIFSTTGGNVTVPGVGTRTYDEGIVVSLVASPDNGYRFVNWTGNASTIANVTAASTTITMNSNCSITANFVAQCNLTISSTAGGLVSTPGEGTLTYDAGTVVNLVATPDTGCSFVNWTGDVGTIADVNAATTNITMSGNYFIMANFGGVCGNYCDLLNHIITSQNGLDLRRVNLIYPEGNGPVEYYGGPWPTPNELSAFYWQNVENTTPYSSSTIDLAGIDMAIGPLYINGTLEIRNSSSTPATLRLAGTVYITGDTSIGMVAKDMTIELSGNTIFVSGSTTVGSKCTMKGPGAIIVVGDIYSAIKAQSTTDPVFVLSVSGTITMQPGGNLYGAFAGSVAVEIQQGTTPAITYPAGGLGSINFPC